MPIDLYLVKLVVGNEGMPGAPLLTAHLAVNVPTGHISGQAEITQAIAPPNDVVSIKDVQGRVAPLHFSPTLRVVTLEGSYVAPFPPPAIGEIVLHFSATLVIHEDDWNGRGSFSYGLHNVDDVPVRYVA